MDEQVVPPEMELVERLRKSIRPALSVRKAATSAEISEGRWRSLAKGVHQVSKGQAIPTRAPADTLARMANVVGAKPEQLREVGRDDAADELALLIGFGAVAPALTKVQDALGLEVESIFALSGSEHDELYRRLARLARAAHDADIKKSFLAALAALEGAQSTVELLIDRVTESASNQQQESHDDLATKPSAEPSTPQTHEDENAGGGGPRNTGDLIEPDPGSEVDIDSYQREVDLAGGWRRGGGKSETRQAREDQDKDAERPD